MNSNSHNELLTRLHNHWIDSMRQVKISQINPNRRERICFTAVVTSKSRIKAQKGSFTKILLRDETGVIYLFVYDEDNENDKIGSQLMTEQSYKFLEPEIRHFNKEFSVGDHVEGAELVIRTSTRIVPLSATETNGQNIAVQKYIPFKFIRLDEIQSLDEGTPVDLIGVVRRIHWSEDEEEDWNWNEMEDGQPPPREFEISDSFGPEGNTLRCTVWEDKYLEIVATGVVIAIKGAKVKSFFRNRPGVNLGNTCEIFFFRLDDDMWRIPQDQMNFYNRIFAEDNYSCSEKEGRYSPMAIANGEIGSPRILETFSESVDLSVIGDHQESFRNGNSETSTQSIRDFVNNITPLKVEVILSTETDVAAMYALNRPEVYKMNSKPRGIALIVNNLFGSKHQILSGRCRKGSFHDERYMQCLWEQMGYMSDIHFDLSLQEFPDKLDLFKKRAENCEVDSIVVVVMSHGVNNLIELIDGKCINLWTDIVYKFRDELCPYLKGKPKTFIFQACQDFNPDSRSYDKKSYVMNDTLVCFPTLPGTPSARDIHLGSWFIYCLTDIFMNNAYNKDAIEMLQMVQEDMTNNIKADNPNERHQCFWITLGFRKRLFFNPSGVLNPVTE